MCVKYYTVKKQNKTYWVALRRNTQQRFETRPTQQQTWDSGRR